MLRRGGRVLPSSLHALIVLPFWVLTAVWLWYWWLLDASKGSLFLYIPLTFALIYETTLIPAVLLYLTIHARAPAKRRAEKNKKVAVITLCVPSSESMDIIENQLKAMSEIDYPHDSWILDEGDSFEIKQLAKRYGVKHFSRKGEKKYNQPAFPFQTRTKAGNVNAWLDSTKRYKYEYFVQLDIDHIPKTNYLSKALGHFRDPKVAWVQSPSVYKNTEYWTARGSAEQEMGMHGPLQMGYYGRNQLPIIVGSHAAYRTSAINEIGGFQPTRAEDQLNTLVLATKGWRGVFVPEVLATGDGPETLKAYLTQQYAWSRSVIHVIKGYSWQYFKKLPLRLLLQFIFLQSWYLISTVTFFILYFTPVLALLLSLHVVSINLHQFIYKVLPFIILSLLALWSAKPLMQPKGLWFSWRGILLHMIRWPSVFSGIMSAITNRKKPYLVTPKGKFLHLIPTVKLYQPFLILGTISALAVIFSIVGYVNPPSVGQVAFALYDSVAMVGVCIIDLTIRVRKGNVRFPTFARYWFKPALAVSAAVLLTAFSFADSFITPLQSSLALSSIKISNVHIINPATLPIESLNDAQLSQEIASPRYALSKSAPVPDVGLYSPIASVHNQGPYINSIFMDWRQNWMLEQGLVQSNRTGGTSLVTVEPKGDADGQRILSDISNGVYDDRLMTILNTIKLDPNTVYVRFAQEMDLPNSFNWGAKDPATYIAAYDHFVDLARTHNITNIKWVWSPAGLPSAAEYYPGDQYVDVVGTTMLYDPFWSGNYHPTFAEIQAVRAWLLAYNKPVWITEFGVGDENSAFQTSLIQSALSEFKADGYQAIVYLNIVDPNVSGPNYSLNDVSVIDNKFTASPISELASVPIFKPVNTIKHSSPNIARSPAKAVKKLTKQDFATANLQSIALQVSANKYKAYVAITWVHSLKSYFDNLKIISSQTKHVLADLGNYHGNWLHDITHQSRNPKRVGSAPTKTINVAKIISTNKQDIVKRLTKK